MCLQSPCQFVRVIYSTGPPDISPRETALLIVLLSLQEYRPASQEELFFSLKTFLCELLVRERQGRGLGEFFLRCQRAALYSYTKYHPVPSLLVASFVGWEYTQPVSISVCLSLYERTQESPTFFLGERITVMAAWIGIQKGNRPNDWQQWHFIRSLLSGFCWPASTFHFHHCHWPRGWDPGKLYRMKLVYYTAGMSKTIGMSSGEMMRSSSCLTSVCLVSRLIFTSLEKKDFKGLGLWWKASDLPLCNSVQFKAILLIT